mmetsp:Transcript_14826/g.31842  ORF Transcript_14826/g.31842 Transcript_14826/m.31842 type:complete len:324 (+) Transcript_14826:1092-2063(+)
MASLTALRTLNLDYVRHPMPFHEELTAALMACTSLTSLSLKNPETMGTDGVLRVVGRLTALTHLDLYQWTESSHAALTESLPSLRDLVTLDLTGTKVAGETLRAMAAAPFTKLESLTLACCPSLDSDALRALVSFPSLRTLYLRDDEDAELFPHLRLRIDSFSPLCSLTSLTELHLDWTTIDAEDLRAFSTLTALHTLSLHGAKFAGEEAEIRAVATLTSLTELDLSSGEDLTYRGLEPDECQSSLSLLTDERVSALSTLTALTRLDLENCIRLTTEGTRSLSTLTALTWLYLEDNACFASDEEWRAVFPRLLDLGPFLRIGM